MSDDIITINFNVDKWTIEFFKNDECMFGGPIQIECTRNGQQLLKEDITFYPFIVYGNSMSKYQNLWQ